MVPNMQGLISQNQYSKDPAPAPDQLLTVTQCAVIQGKNELAQSTGLEVIWIGRTFHLMLAAYDAQSDAEDSHPLDVEAGSL